MEGKGQLAGVVMIFMGLVGAAFQVYTLLQGNLSSGILEIVNAGMNLGFIVSGIGVLAGSAAAFFIAFALVSVALVFDILRFSLFAVAGDTLILIALAKGLIASAYS